MTIIKQAVPNKIEGTNRIEAFSDGVLAIIVTLLIFEVRVPTLPDLSNSAVLAGLLGIAPKVVSLYALVLCLAGLTFWLMNYYVFFKSNLMSETVPVSERWRKLRHGRWAFILYGLAALVAFINVYAALNMLAAIPFIFVMPKLMREAE